MFTFVKGIIKRLTKRNGDLSALFSINTNGCNVLRLATCAGHLEVCRYLVEELGGDVNAPGFGDTALGLSLSLSPFFNLVATM